MTKGYYRTALRDLSASYTQIWTASHNYRMSADARKLSYWLSQTLQGAQKFMGAAKMAENDWVAQWAIKEFMPQSVTELETKIQWFRDLPKFLKSDQKSYHEFCGSIIGFITQAILAKNQQSGPYVALEQPVPKPESNKVTAPGVLEAGAKHMRDRAETYDKPEGERSMEKVVQMFNILYGHTLTETEGWRFMMLLKLVRSTQGAFKLDNFEDAVAYEALAAEAAAKGN